MSLEAIKQVTQAEEETQARLAEAKINAKRMVADAEREGRAQVESARAQAETKAKDLMKQAEVRAHDRTTAVMHETEQSCATLRQAAEAKLDAAADLIVRRVVND